MVPGFFAESEHKIVRCLQHAAAQETAANPRPWACSIANLIVATASKQCCQKDTRLAWRYTIGSSAMPLPLTSLLPEWEEWKRGYLQNPSWQQPPLELDASNRITRKHQSQKHRPSVRRDSGKVPEKTLAALKERDEKRAMQRKARPKNKYSSAWCRKWRELVMWKRCAEWWNCHWRHKHWKTEGEWKTEGKIYIPFFAHWVLPAPHMFFLFDMYIYNIWYLFICTIHWFLRFKWSFIVLVPFVSARKRPLIGICFLGCVVACDWPMSPKCSTMLTRLASSQKRTKQSKKH